MPADTIYIAGHAKDGLGDRGSPGGDALQGITSTPCSRLRAQGHRKGGLEGRDRHATAALPGFETFQNAPPAPDALAGVLGVAYDELTVK